MYKILPETEGRTLEEIEIYFSDNTRKLTDRKIPMSAKKSKDIEAHEQKAQKPISMISDIVELNENRIQRNGNLNNGCDNKGFTLESKDH